MPAKQTSADHGRDSTPVVNVEAVTETENLER